ncbi:DNA-processing protein DprA [Mycoplasma sp. Mirounga ES2805-ORL]|uniref:DNA-processing protein DprA n=1 Tax=Mycoplasma sp. Mirounga ES2805-ORL TaxID=754514 RepID=UPI00197BA231|nr:DNA-processing protein DprA [Mycoplasma sp. Mirounga ES2805-ORL]QSF13911.1 DNA-processing protein DprA [Mycoplasma sp. Mirounga ES2805-ORL]
MKELLVYFSYLYEGNLSKINKALLNKEKVSNERIEEVLTILKIKNIKYLTILDDKYPFFLKEYKYSPLVFFYRGNINLINNRLACLTGDIINELTLKNLHKSLNKLIYTHNFISSGFKNLEQEILNFYRKYKKPVIHLLAFGHDFFNDYKDFENELYISVYPPSTNPKLQRFKDRNNLASMLAEFLIIYNSKHDSGIINLATAFANNNKDVYCYPSSNYNDGNTFLIKSGANLITHVADINFY